MEVLRRYSKTPTLPKLTQFVTLSDRPTAARIQQAHKRLGPEIVSRLVAEYEAGAPSTALMARYGLGKGTVLSLLPEHGVKTRRQGLSAGDLPPAIELYKAGWSLQRLGERFSCDAETVRKRLRRVGVQRRDCHERAPQDLG